MKNLNFPEFREDLGREHQSIFATNKISVLLLSFINTDRGVNYGCNLKWKLADKNEFMLATGVNLKTKHISRSLK